MQPKKILASVLIIAGAFLPSCKKAFLEPDQQTFYTESRFFKDPGFSEGIILNSYASLPSTYISSSGSSIVSTMSETATDDAVTNKNGDNYRRMATGEWSSQFYPLSNWDIAYNSIYYVNYFLSIVDKVEWSWQSPLRNRLFKNKLTGEAYGLRAWYNFELLKQHGGRASDGTLLGFVIMDSTLVKSSDWKLPRSTYDDCVQFIYDDIDRGFALLPFDFKNTSDVDSTRVLGTVNVNRISGRILKALKSRVALYVASQAFSPSIEKWEAGADAAAFLLKNIGNVAGLSASGNTFYLNFKDADIIWRRAYNSINSWESANLPPSLYGYGRTNPSQNLVDAFPMANGYPITNSSSGYNPNSPYTNRDPRLKKYIVYNGNTVGSTVINTKTEDATNGINNLSNQSTRTGYYLLKLMIPTVNLAPNVNSSKQHFYTFLRYTEIFLNYAEAANEAWGPIGDPKGNGFNAKTIIGAIRERAGITQPDAYLATITTTGAMRDLIRNERRIELCFEGSRFWDLRRWDLDLTETVKGMSITNNVYTVIDVENRLYEPYMKYGPIPYLEVLKDNKIIQNAGW